METGIIDALPIWGVYIGLTLCILFSFEVGYQINRYNTATNNTDNSTATTPMVGGLLTMLAFVLAFTFSMASSQHKTRKQNVLDESNTISTAFLRTDLVTEPYKTEIQKLLLEYVDIRLQVVAKSDQTHTFEKLIDRSVELHDLLWTQVSLAAIKSPNTNTSLLAKSVNKVIEVHYKRLTSALHNRIPSSIWWTLLVISILTMITIGNQAGISQSRRLVAVIPLIMAFSALTTVIIDLDRPQQGMIKVGQQTMVDLHERMKRKI